MYSKRFNLTSHWAELGERFKKICLKKDILQRTYGNNPRLESHQKFQTSGGKGNQDKGESSHYQSYRRTADPHRNTQIPSGSQRVGKTSSPVASEHSGTNI
ncbi:hypothetical protein O181_035294 [Austropuccinia psidii MF-1]|uniref:Uncharacterized protein n=1 Tax=Austropuccinia psidii MF-1 TaxID=1389203 RepID=A0A9Q3HAE2_9BASI|nr:hypothetical protein [Austropuccinia psidii MF-1]